MKQFLIFFGICTLLWEVHIPHLSAQTYSDTTWERLYFGPPIREEPRSNKHLETYDKGYLLGAWYGEDTQPKPILIKTDINGYHLWERILDTTENASISTMVEDYYGGVVIAGGVNGLNNRIPWVIKLNSCFEIEWCKKFEWDISSYAYDIEIDQNGDIVVLTRYYGDSPGERINLIKLSPDGELIWKKNYATIEEHPWIWNAQGNQLIISEGNSYYITGQAWWPNNNDPNQGSGLRPFFVKVSENGYEEWIMPFGIYNQLYGYASRSYQIDDTLFLSVAYNLPGPSVDQIQVILVWYNIYGEVIHFTTEPLLEGLFYDVSIYDAVLQNDGNLWGIMQYNYYENEDESHRGYIKIDTALNVLDFIEDDRWGGRHSLFQTYNDKFITVAAKQEDAPGFIYDVYISKRNEDYSFDTVYSNWPGSFDSLCPHAIESGYLPYECETIIVGTNEIEERAKQELKIKITPNPAKNMVNLSFENNTYKKLHLQIFNINGEEVFNRKLHSYPQDTEIDISNLAKGVYLVAVRSKDSIVGREKLIID